MEGHPQHALTDGGAALKTCQHIAQAVKDDIRQVLANSWELQQLNHTAPKVCQATLDRLALPRKARVQQEVTHSLHDVNDFAKWKAAQLAQKRAARGIREVEQQMLLSSQKEALEGWHRQQEQFGHQLHLLHQQQLQQQQQQAKLMSALVTQRAKNGLQLLTETQQRKKLHASELHVQLNKQHMDTRLS